MRRFAYAILFAALIGGGVFWTVTAPKRLAPETFAGLTPDATHGALVFTAAGCASCHMALGAAGEAELVLSGGQAFPTEFGTFHAPNISPDPVFGIGDWSVQDFGNAVMAGVSPDGRHYYPALPYWSYAGMVPQDLVDLHAYMQMLPPSAAPNLPNDVAFPFSIRRLVGGWKTLAPRPDFMVQGDLTAAEVRGRYITESLSHCAECHTPRDALGRLDVGRWLAGGPDPSGKGRIPNITPAALNWSEGDIVAYLTTGFTPDYDVVGGHMAHVVENMARLPESDRRAVAAYLKRVPPVP
jgi:mono/diheme cytochrome c family protein